MRTTSSRLGEIVKHSLARELVADVYYGPERILGDVPVSDWSIHQDYDANIKTGVNLTVAYVDEFAESYSPREVTDAFASFGQTMRLYETISAAGYSERVPIGVFRIESSPSARDEQTRFQGRTVTKGSVLELTLLDLFMGVDRAKFRLLESTPLSGSAWAEIARITGLQVTRNVTDATIPASVVYSRDRLAGVQSLARLLGGRAYVVSDGSVSIIPDVAGAAVATLEIGEEGVVLDVEYSQQSEGRFNVVILDTEDSDGNPIHAEAEVTSGPLATSTPYGEYVTEYPNDELGFVTTQAAANVAAAAHLAIVSAQQLEIPVTCLYDPRLEIGDVVEVEQLDRLLTGRITTLDAGKQGTMNLRLGLLDDQPI